MDLIIREARVSDAARLIETERVCFPPNEAEKPENIMKRLVAAPELFLIAEDAADHRIAGFICGVPTDEDAFRDEFFTDVGLIDFRGRNVILLSLEVAPEYRGQGVAGRLMYALAERAKLGGKRKLILTCHEELISFYEGMGFAHNGRADSSWGGAEWQEMVKNIDK